MKAIDFFSGIGGLSCALEGHGTVVAAYEQNRIANRVYRLNHGLVPIPKEISGLEAKEILQHGADFWMLSPPCQPYTVRGAGLDLNDARAAALLHLIDLIERCRPAFFFLENVVPFSSSMTRERLLGALEAAGYHVLEKTLCPSELGIPNRRPRYYLLASQQRLNTDVPYTRCDLPLASYLDTDPPASFELPQEILERYRDALSIVYPGDEVTACFARSYGRTHVRSGSYLKTERGARFFTPAEIARLLHFPNTFRFPDDLRLRDRYRLLGNSVSISAVQELFKHFDWRTM